MEHLITPTEFFNCGLPVSDDITTAEVDFAVNTVEQYFIVPFLGDLFGEILDCESGSTYWDILNAPDGLKMAMFHLTFAYLVYDKIRLTRYSSVIKNDEHSTDPSFADVKKISNLHWEIGFSFLLKICEKLSIDTKAIQRNDLIFNELVY